MGGVCVGQYMGCWQQILTSILCNIYPLESVYRHDYGQNNAEHLKSEKFTFEVDQLHFSGVFLGGNVERQNSSLAVFIFFFVGFYLTYLSSTYIDGPISILHLDSSYTIFSNTPSIRPDAGRFALSVPYEAGAGLSHRHTQHWLYLLDFSLFCLLFQNLFSGLNTKYPHRLKTCARGGWTSTPQKQA